MMSRIGPWALIATVSAAMLGGCVANDDTVSIDHFITLSPTATTCAFDPMSAPLISRGVYDLGFGTSYIVNFAVTNNVLIVPSTDDIERNAFYVRSFDVELVVNGKDPVAAAIPVSSRKFSVPHAAVRLAPQETAALSLQVLSPAVLPGLAQLQATPRPGSVTARIRAISSRAEEEHVGAWSAFPIDLCLGCLAIDEGKCPLKTVTRTGSACNTGQDYGISCCESTDNRLVCGGAATSAAAP